MCAIPSKLLNDSSKHDLTLFEVEQDVIKKVVPMVVRIIKETVANKFFSSSKLTRCSDISIAVDETENVRNALDKFICILSNKKIALKKTDQNMS